MNIIPSDSSEITCISKSLFNMVVVTKALDTCSFKGTVVGLGDQIPITSFLLASAGRAWDDTRWL